MELLEQAAVILVEKPGVGHMGACSVWNGRTDGAHLRVLLIFKKGGAIWLGTSKNNQIL
jgi:hypothetical protein